MALDIYNVPPCSEAPERVFSIAGNTITPRRRVMTADTIQELLCLRSWQESGIVKLDRGLFEKAVERTTEEERQLNSAISASMRADGGDDVVEIEIRLHVFTFITTTSGSSRGITMNDKLRSDLTTADG